MTIPASPPLTGLTSPRGFARMQEFGLLVVIVGLGLLLSVYGWQDARPGRPNTFLNQGNLIDGIATPMSYYAIMAIGMTIVVISGGIDISVSSTMALSGLVTAWALQQFPPDANPLIVGPLSIVIPLAVGLTCGLINGALIVGLRLHPFIVTLGTLSVFRGMCNVLPFGTQTLPMAGKPLPDWSATHLFRTSFFGMELFPLVVMLVCVGLGWIYLSYSVYGRETYAVGGNEEAARFSGIPVGMVKMRVYAIAGLLAGLAGLVSLGRFGTINTNSASGYELTVVAASVVGGASLAGGRGTALGALLGTLILAMIQNAIDILRLNQEYTRIIVGLAIIVAVAIDRLSDFIRARTTRGASKVH